MICLGMLSTRLFLSHDLDNRFGGLTLFDSSYFFVFFFNQFFLILSFNTRLTDNWASYFISICFLMGYSGLITQVVGLTSKPELTRVIFLSHFLNFFFQFYSSILSLLKFESRDLCWFTFNKVIMISWLGMRIDML